MVVRGKSLPRTRRTSGPAWANIDYAHPRFAGRGQPGVSVFKGDALGRIDLDSLRCYEKDVRCRFRAACLVGTHHGVEPIEHADRLQGRLGGSRSAARGNRHGQNSAKATGDLDYDFNGPEEIERLAMEDVVPLLGDDGDVDEQAFFVG